jgi:CheY-like chemotaxis protein
MTKHGTILLVEDNVNDIALIKKAFAEAEVLNPVQTVHSGEEAVKYLSGADRFTDRERYPVPFLVLLDLNLAQEGGFAMLRWLYERPGLKKKFTLIVLGADTSDSEIQLAYELGAQSYLVKPLDFKQLTDTVRHVKEYWIELNRLPENAT